ncbi:MAG: Fic family protein [Chitinivibrionales bacterium]|nr:Fic family protein [Chitinivibrionales bacterium]
MHELFTRLSHSSEHPLITNAVFHYEFEFIHPFEDGNGRIGRLRQTGILCKWETVFKYIPVESLISENRKEHYNAINSCNNSGNSTEFIRFTMRIIHYSLLAALSLTEQATEQVKSLLTVMGKKRYSAKELMEMLNLSHRPSFLYSYLKPALSCGLIAMSNPESPRSPRQMYSLTLKGNNLKKRLHKSNLP